jgi:membrane-associated phospholipid phosphatase
MCFFAMTGIAFGQATSSALSDPDAGSAHSTGQQTDSADGPAADIPDTPKPEDTENKVFTLPKALFHDQIGMWTSPSKVRLADATWLVPVGGFTAALLATDGGVSPYLSNNTNTLKRYRDISVYGAYGMAGGAAGTYLLGLTTHNEHERETGFLSGEAAIDSLIAVEALKFATGRQRPYQGNGSGPFWKGGSSFPSEHAAGAWAIAGIAAHEYPSPFMKFVSYGLATVISASRITAKQHFPSDVLVGAAIGYLTSEYVYRHHHNPELRGGTWETPAIRPDRPSHWQAKFMGSPYVPLDNWIYPALDRLIAMGYISSAFLGMRPWTRMECARLLQESQDRITDPENDGSEAWRLQRELSNEFQSEINLLGGGDNAQFRIESIYTRGTVISGPPLTNGYVFGQTIINDYGRPYEEGFNNVSGASTWGEIGPFVGYVRGEFQHAASAPPLSDAERMIIQDAELLPTEAPATPISAIDRMDALEAYVGMNFGNWQVSFGKQSQWWGPDASGPMMLSNNAEPVMMFKLDRVSPFKLPWILGLMGPIRAQFFLGQLQGHHFLFGTTGLIGSYATPVHPQPMILGYKLSFKPTPNVEYGLSLTRVFAGQGVPFTFHKFEQALFGHNGAPGSSSDPGDGRTGFDLSYRLPWMRKWATFYADGFSEDEISPLAYWDRSAWVSGMYFSRLPKIPKLDLRVEGGYTDLPIGGKVGPGYFYFNYRYRDGYTNWGNLLGNWMGRAAQVGQAWSTYWFTPRDNLQFTFRHQKVSREFLDGGTLTNASVTGNFWARSTFSLSASVQYEAWNYPTIVSTRQSDVSTTLQFTFWPKAIVHKKSSE